MALSQEAFTPEEAQAFADKLKGFANELTPKERSALRMFFERVVNDPENDVTGHWSDLDSVYDKLLQQLPYQPDTH